MDSANFIQKALEDYSGPIEASRPIPGGLGTYKVSKPWGHEIWMDLNEFYVLKLIHMKKGFKSSLQSHDYKVECNTIIEGRAEILLEDSNGNLVSYIKEKGDGWIVKPGQKHRVIALTDYTAIEASSPHLDDVVRYNDEYKRSDGKINSEHPI